MIPLIYIVIFLFLAFNQSLHIFGGDSGEYSLVARTWSIPHPPGYPFYSLLINIINHAFPFFTTSWKIALLSSVATVLTAWVLYKILLLLKVEKWPALFSSLLYIFLFPVWLYGEIPEVFALNSLLIALVTYFILQYRNTNKIRFLLLTAFFLGLCVSHHQIFVLFIPGWMYLLSGKSVRSVLFKLSKKSLFTLGGLFLLGFSFYLYAPIASHFNPPLDWENPQTPLGFFRLITRAAYGTFKAYPGTTGSMTYRIFDVISFFIMLLMDFRIAGIVTMMLGFYVLFKKKRRIFYFVIITSSVYLFFLFYSNFVLLGSFTLAMYERFLIAFYMLLIIPFAYGANWFYIFAQTIIKKKVQNEFLIKLTSMLLFFIIPAYIITITVQNYKTISQVKNMDIFATYAKNILDTVPSGSIVYAASDNTYFTALYYFVTEHYRTDVKYIQMNIMNKKNYQDKVKKEFPGIHIPPNKDGAFDAKEFLKQNESLGIYVETPLTNDLWAPYGLLWKYYSSQEKYASESASILSANKRLWTSVYTIPVLNQYLRNILHLNVVQDHYIRAYFDFSRLLFMNDEIHLAINVITNLMNHLAKNDKKIPLILTNLYMYQNNCVKAREVMGSFDYRSLQNYPGYAPTVLNYFKQCDPMNVHKSVIEQYQATYEKMNNIPLNQF